MSSNIISTASSSRLPDTAVDLEWEKSDRQKRRDASSAMAQQQILWADEHSKSLSAWAKKRHDTVSPTSITRGGVMAATFLVTKDDFIRRQLRVNGEDLRQAIQMIVLDHNFLAISAFLRNPLSTRCSDWPEAFGSGILDESCLYIRQTIQYDVGDDDVLHQYTQKYPGDDFHSDFVRREIAEHQLKSFVMSYGGTTHSNTPAGREEEDRNKTIATRFGNYKSIFRSHGEKELATYSLLGVEDGVAGDDRAAYRTNRQAQLMEMILISILGPTGMNSAPGGFYSFWRPDSLLSGLSEALLKAVPPFSATSNGITSTGSSLVLHDGIKALPDGVEAVKGQPLVRATTMMSTAKTGLLTIMKDISAEDFKDTTDTAHFNGPCTGRGPMLAQDLYKHLSSLCGKDTGLPDSLIEWSSFCNLWSCSLDHEAFLIMILILLRYIESLRHLRFIRLDSAIVMALFLDLESPLARAEELTGRSRVDLLDLTKPLKSMVGALSENKAYYSVPGNKEWGNRANVPFMVYIPGRFRFRRVVAIGCLDVGSVKYDPFLATSRCQLIWSASVIQALGILLPTAKHCKYDSISNVAMGEPENTSAEATEAIKKVLPMAQHSDFSKLISFISEAKVELEKLHGTTLGRRARRSVSVESPEKKAERRHGNNSHWDNASVAQRSAFYSSRKEAGKKGAEKMREIKKRKAERGETVEKQNRNRLKSLPNADRDYILGHARLEQVDKGYEWKIPLAKRPELGKLYGRTNDQIHGFVRTNRKRFPKPVLGAVNPFAGLPRPAQDDDDDDDEDESDDEKSD